MKVFRAECPDCHYEWETQNRSSGVLKCSKCHRTFPNPNSLNPGIEVKCPNCNHIWTTQSKSDEVLCNRCHKVFTILDNEHKPTIQQRKIRYINVVCSKCGHKWEYHGDKSLGELDLCPFCGHNTRLKEYVSELIPTNTPKYSGTTRINFGAIFTKHEPEFKMLMEKYNIESEIAVKTAMKMFSVLINHFENNSFSIKELAQIIQISQQAELPAIAVIAQDRLNKMEKSEKDKVILDFLLKK